MGVASSALALSYVTENVTFCCHKSAIPSPISWNESKTDEDVPRRTGPNGTRREHLPANRIRRRHDSLKVQLKVFGPYMKGEPPWQIAKAFARGFGQFRLHSRNALARNGWERQHLNTCPRCGRKAKFMHDCAAVMKHCQAQVNAVAEAAKESERPTYLL